MPFTYAVPDLHGRFDLLELAVATVANRGGGTVVFLGDYVDRGPESRQIIERLMAGPPEGQCWITLSGNHEQMMFCCYLGLASRALWLENGGDATLSSYGGEVPKEHLGWIRSLPRLHPTPHRVFVHASVDPTLPLAEHTEEIALWQRYPKGMDIGYGELHVVHGHTPVRSGPELFRHRTNLDTLAWHSGRLAVGVFDDDVPGGPVEIVWVESYPYEHLMRGVA